MKNYIFFDLETNGLDLKKSAIMQITIINSNGSIIYNKYVYPHDNKIEATQILSKSLSETSKMKPKNFQNGRSNPPKSRLN